MMNNRFFEKPVINSPYEYPARYWELDDHGQPTQRKIESRLWAFAEFTEIYRFEANFKAKVESGFNKMIEGMVK